MHEYFVVQIAECKSKFSSPDEMLNRGLAAAFSDDPKKHIEAEQAALAARLNVQLKPIVLRSFKHHDKNDDGVLDAEESAKFFEHYAAEYEAMLEATTEIAIMKSLDMMLEMMKPMVEMMKVDLASQFNFIFQGD